MEEDGEGGWMHGWMEGGGKNGGMQQAAGVEEAWPEDGGMRNAEGEGDGQIKGLGGCKD